MHILSDKEIGDIDKRLQELGTSYTTLSFIES